MMPIRQWATPLTMGAFVLMTTTGINAGAHEWVAWAFVLGVVGHLTANFRPLKNHLKSGWGRTSVGIFAVLLVGSFFTRGFRTGGQLTNAVLTGLTDAPLSTLAVVAHTTPEALGQRLQARGIDAHPDRTVREIAGGSKSRMQHVLEVVFLP